MGTYSIGGKVYDSLYAGSMEVMYAGNTWNKHALRRWQQPGDITDVPRIQIGGSYTASDRFLVCYQKYHFGLHYSQTMAKEGRARVCPHIRIGR